MDKGFAKDETTWRCSRQLVTQKEEKEAQEEKMNRNMAAKKPALAAPWRRPSLRSSKHRREPPTRQYVNGQAVNVGSFSFSFPWEFLCHGNRSDPATTIPVMVAAVAGTSDDREAPPDAAVRSRVMTGHGPL